MARSKNRVIEVDVKNREFPDISTAIYEDKLIKFKGGIPGQKVKIRLSRKKHNYTKANLVEVLEKSPLEKNEGCPRYMECGGCDYQSIPYETELLLKLQQIQDLF